MKEYIIGLFLITTNCNCLAEPIDKTPSPTFEPSTNLSTETDKSKANIDEKAAFTWFLNASEKGNPEAQFNVGMMYMAGRGIDVNFQKAAYWYQKSADQGYAPAQHNLGMMYISGTGISPNLNQGIYWLRKAADQGDILAQNILRLISTP